MYFFHSPEIWSEFPELAAGVIFADGVDAQASTSEAAEPYLERARIRLAGAQEGELPEIQAWRRTFSRMGLKPTQYRCASEALLRRFRKEQDLPQIHPLVDLCNAASMAFAIPVAAFNTSRIAGGLVVRRASGTESYASFSGETEQPEPGEIIFADERGAAHARRWTNRQSRDSAIGSGTRSVMIVAEAFHSTAQEDVRGLVAGLAGAIGTAWGTAASTTMLSREAPRAEQGDDASAPQGGGLTGAARPGATA